jgi:DNA-directed RNA polymerase alpha subunit
MNNQLFQDLTIQSQEESDSDLRQLIHEQLCKSIDILDLSLWLKNKLKEHNLLTIQDVLDKPEADMQNMRYVGEKRARRISNAAIAEFLEYLSG